MSNSSTNRKQTGLTLIELMVALTLSLLLLAGVIQIFIASKQSYRMTEGLSRLQENARFAMHFIVRDLRMAGYAGCTNNLLNHLNPAGTGYSDTLFNLSNAVGGWDYVGTAPGENLTLSTLDPTDATAGAVAKWDDQADVDLDTNLEDLIIPGTDILIIKKAGTSLGINPTGNTPANAATINVSGASGIDKGTIVIISDCQGSDAYQNRSNDNANSVSRGASSNNNPGPGNLAPGGDEFTHQYDSTAEFLIQTGTIYFIGQSASSTAGNIVPALFRINYTTGSLAGATPEELIEGVENMQVLVGEDTDSPDDIANKYVTIDDVTDPDEVVSIKFSLLVRTEEEVIPTNTAKAYSLLSTNITNISDRRLRRVFNATVKLRNRGVL